MPPFSRWRRRLAGGVMALAIAGGLARAAETERNLWPLVVQQKDSAGRIASWTGAGPFLFRRPTNEGGTASGFRPFWVQTHNAQGEFRAGYFLYPLFSYTVDENTYRWSVMELVRRADRRARAGAPQSMFDSRGELEIWPFWFSRQTGDPELSYRGLFPLFGTIKNKLGFDRLSWTFFPLYVESERRGAVTTSTPWPFVRVTRGAARGCGLWPLFYWQERPGVSREEYYLWPFGYNVARQPAPDDPPGTQPKRDVGALPFYAKSTGAGYVNQDFLWPFFGYTDRTLPTRYHETRYFWPLLVQGRGDDRYVNRWGPFYTHSVNKGYDKRWFAWPLLRHAHWTDEGVARTRAQLLYFIYWSEVQRAGHDRDAAPAELRHVWPLFSHWDNGSGRRQWQVFSPFDVFFPGNEKVRHAWSPIFAIARHEQRAPGETRTALLWNAITWEQRATEARREFHLGFLFSTTSDAGGKRIAIGNGLLGLERGPASTGWRVFWLDFRSKSATTPLPSR